MSDPNNFVLKPIKCHICDAVVAHAYGYSHVRCVCQQCRSLYMSAVELLMGKTGQLIVRQMVMDHFSNMPKTYSRAQHENADEFLRVARNYPDRAFEMIGETSHLTKQNQQGIVPDGPTVSEDDGQQN